MFKFISFILLLLLTACDCKILIDIKTSNILNKTIIKYQGSNIKAVTYKEIQLFNITDDNLKEGVKKELGKAPNEVFLKDPTKYGDVFMKYKWPDVKRKLSVSNVKIIDFIKENVELQRYGNVNNSTDILVSKIDIVEPVSNAVRALWPNTGLPDDEINYDFHIDFGYGEVMFTTRWRNPNTTVFDFVIRNTEGNVHIKPGQSIVTKLLGEKVILLMQVDFHAHLIGNIVANYAHTYGKYHLWSPTIGNIMKAANLTNEITTKMLFEIRYDTNTRLALFDKDTGDNIIVKDKQVQRRRKQKFHFPAKTCNNDSK